MFSKKSQKTKWPINIFKRLTQETRKLKPQCNSICSVELSAFRSITFSSSALSTGQVTYDFWVSGASERYQREIPAHVEGEPKASPLFSDSCSSSGSFHGFSFRLPSPTPALVSDRDSSFRSLYQLGPVSL